MQMLSLGQRFASLKDFLKAVENHEIASTGVFEVSKLAMSSGKTRFVCNCSEIVEKIGKRCSAFIIAETDNSLVTIVDSNLFHMHKAKKTASPSTSAIIPRIQNINLPRPAAFSGPQNLRSLSMTKNRVLAANSFHARLLLVPRYFPVESDDEDTVDLTSQVIRSDDARFHCPYCPSFHSLSRQVTDAHMKVMHEKRMVIGKCKAFVPCLANCQTLVQYTRVYAPAVHYHCVCNVLFVSEKAITMHLNSGGCKAFHEEPRKNPAQRARQNQRPVKNAEHQKTIPPRDSRKRAGTASAAALNQMANLPSQVTSSRIAPTVETSAKRRLVVRPLTTDQTRAVDSGNTGNLVEEAMDETQGIGKEQENGNSSCPVCTGEYSNFRDMMEHIRSDHPNAKAFIPVNLICTICGKKMEMVDQLAVHYRDQHQIVECQIQSELFENANGFYSWKSELEEKSTTYFARRRRTVGDDDVAFFFHCSSSWADRRRTSKEKKQERHCPAFIKAVQRQNDSKVSVTYCAYHAGHEINREPFWKSINRSLHSMITFRRHKEGQEEQRPIETVTSSTDQPQSTQNQPTEAESMVDLDKEVNFYWDLMRKKLEESGSYALSVSERWSNEGNRLCGVCQVEFKNQNFLMRHMLRKHGGKQRPPVKARSKFRRAVRCLLCNMEMTSPGMKNLITHYVIAHNLDIQLKEAIFRNEEEFEYWRNDHAGVEFRCSKAYLTKNGGQRRYWGCRHSGKLENRTVGVTEGHCPGWIFALKMPGKDEIAVSYCLNHVGHKTSEPCGQQPIQPAPSNAPKILVSPVQLFLTAPQTSTSTFFPISLTTNSSMIRAWEPSQVTNSQAPQPVMSRPMTMEDEYIMNAPSLGNVENAVLQASESLRSPGATLTVIDSGVAFTANPNSGGQQSMTNFGQSDQMMTPSTSSSHVIGVESMVAKSTDRKQIEVMIHSSSGQERLVKLSLADFPLIEKDGNRYYAVQENSLIDAVSQVLARRGEGLYVGDHITILHDPPSME